jgi:polyisoprenoid-binding protein YceI
MTTATATETWAIDASHSTAEFSVRHLMLAKVRGGFSELKGTIVTPAGVNAPEKVSAEIAVASIHTRNEDRDNHLRSADFFDAEQHPTISFESTAVHQHDGEIEIEGNLTMRGITKKVLLEVEFEGRGKDPWGGDRIAYSAVTKIDRKEFGLVWNQTLDAGGVAVGDEVKIDLQIEAVKQA